MVEQPGQRRDLELERERLVGPVAVGHPAAEPVVADDLPPAGQCVDEVAEPLVLPVLDDVAHPPRRQYERQAGADRRECDPVPVQPKDARLLPAHEERVDPAEAACRHGVGR